MNRSRSKENLKQSIRRRRHRGRASCSRKQTDEKRKNPAKVRTIGKSRNAGKCRTETGGTASGEPTTSKNTSHSKSLRSSRRHRKWKMRRKTGGGRRSCSMQKNKEEDGKEKLQPQHAEKRGGRQEGAPGNAACGKKGVDTKGAGADETEDRRTQQPQRTKQRRSNNTELKEQQQP